MSAPPPNECSSPGHTRGQLCWALRQLRGEIPPSTPNPSKQPLNLEWKARHRSEGEHVVPPHTTLTREGQTTPTREGQTKPTREGKTTPTRDGQTTPTREGQTTPARERQTTPTREGQTTPTREGKTTPARERKTTPARERQTTPTREGQTTPTREGRGRKAKGRVLPANQLFRTAPKDCLHHSSADRWNTSPGKSGSSSEWLQQ